MDVLGLVVSVDRCERGKGEKSALTEIQEKYGFKTTAIVTMKEVVEHLYNSEYKGNVVIDDTLKADVYKRQCMALKKKLGWAILNPLLVAILLVMALLKATGISYGDYNQGASYISYFLTPATVCLAIPLYKQLELLKKNLAAVLCGITTGAVSYTHLRYQY